ncbi:hypothetical protein [Dactylosporangium sp. CA-092794]|uniref:hypothetical protein n=1 Tax=Dactylosporangium sp. CA-092794 TaxID=3239929 RepID=UPI003D8B7A22
MDRLSSRARWADAAAVLAVVVTVILAARQLRPLAEAGAFLARTGETFAVVPASAWPRAAVWVAVSGAVLLRRWIAAAVGAWAAVLFEIVEAARRVNGAPLDLLAWPVLLAVTAALLLSVSAPAGRGLELLGRRGLWLLAGAATATTLTATAIPFLGEYYQPGVAFAIPTRLADAVAGVTFAGVLVLVLATVSGVDRSVRLRVYTLIGTGLAGFAGIQFGLPFPFSMSTVPVLSRPTQAVLLVLGPCLVFGAGLVVVWFTQRKVVQRSRGM